MIAGKGANSVGTEEFIFIQHSREHAAQFGFIENRAEATIRNTGFGWIVDEGLEFRTCLQETQELFNDVRILLSKIATEDCDRTERKQPDHGADFQALGVTVRGLKHIIKESIFFIPHAGITARADGG